MANKDIHILLVDDTDCYRRPMEFWLKSKGYRVTGTSNGADAIAIIARERPTIVCLDMKMPGMDGIETLREIRKLDQTLPVIMLTAYGTPQDMKIAETLGIAGFFMKEDDFTVAAKLIVIALESGNMSITGQHNI